MRFPSRIRSALVLGLGLLLALPTARAMAQDPLVLAAASLKDALDEAAGLWKQQSGGGPVTISYASSGALAKQIENGAPADIFISASIKFICSELVPKFQ